MKSEKESKTKKSSTQTAKTKSKAATRSVKKPAPKSLNEQYAELALKDDWTDGDWGHWHLGNGVKSPSILPLGFVYRITEKATGKSYIGQKKVTTIETRPPLKGYVRRRKLIKQTDWRTYCGSSNDVKIAITKKGEEAFDFEIMCFTDSKWMLSYLELWFQMNENVMFDDMSWNGIVNVRLSKFASMKPKWEQFKKDYPQYFS